ncbi:FlgT C-terminal domain-containing protein [Fructobacillus tropaeoli]|uniref:FlgT C-terminal domain-containing protein n=1 Tax=Fructobacillus tropaeoli TaxID=709323 RepID=UPI0019433F19|nr:FlgT C-terminal domain-containing protein [Fructobacillus tropaeoli]GIC70574.1 hypothetical protein FT12353_12490 [Fructobacillus tropaeoli]
MAFKTHVGKIISDKAIIISSGLDDGIKVGDEFNIVQEGNEIFDDFTKESLGKYTRTKTKVEITEVQEQFSIAKKLVRQSLLKPAIISSSFMTSTNTVDLPINKQEISKVNDLNFDENIHVGDVAVKLN